MAFWDFARLQPLHVGIYEAISTLIGSGRRADPFTLQPFFENAEAIDAKTTIAQYLGSLGANVPTLTNASEYARTVRDLFIRRRLILISEDVRRAAYDAPADFSLASRSLSTNSASLRSTAAARGSLLYPRRASPVDRCRPANGTPKA